MILALVGKELRETWAFVVPALAVYLVLVARLTGGGGPLLEALTSSVPGMNVRPLDVPFVDGELLGILFFVGAALAITLGFRQSAWEPSQGTAVYLLQMPMSRRGIFLTKVITGAGLVLACSLVPILGYAVWAATPGTHVGPFAWSMTGPAFRTWLVLALVYLGSFAGGIRPARWFGSRLFPLLSVGVPCGIAFVSSNWWLVGLPVVGLTAALLVSDILWVASTRDY